MLKYILALCAVLAILVARDIITATVFSAATTRPASYDVHESARRAERMLRANMLNTLNAATTRRQAEKLAFHAAIDSAEPSWLRCKAVAAKAKVTDLRLADRGLLAKCTGKDPRTAKAVQAVQADIVQAEAWAKSAIRQGSPEQHAANEDVRRWGNDITLFWEGAHKANSSSNS